MSAKIKGCDTWFVPFLKRFWVRNKYPKVTSKAFNYLDKDQASEVSEDEQTLIFQRRVVQKYISKIHIHKNIYTPVDAFGNNTDNDFGNKEESAKNSLSGNTWVVKVKK